MGKAWAVPVAVLGGIVAVGLIFIWWWFPRAWKKGDKSDKAEVNAVTGEQRELQRLKNREIIDGYTRRLAIERGDVVAGDADVERGIIQPPPAYQHDTTVDGRIPNAVNAV
ncbi:hypothetical protein LTR53_014993 [Teratosphaeriaceae sp. CCFEE 6253]|nr:hypothetical protein LTR53_014993 [Teratosphaeriaceae sp. CCFEE 6253]